MEGLRARTGPRAGEPGREMQDRPQFAGRHRGPHRGDCGDLTHQWWAPRDVRPLAFRMPSSEATSVPDTIRSTRRGVLVTHFTTLHRIARAMPLVAGYFTSLTDPV